MEKQNEDYNLMPKHSSSSLSFAIGQLYTKMSNFHFDSPIVAYLGHLLSIEGVNIDPNITKGYVKLAKTNN